MGFDPERKFWVDERVYEHMSLASRARRREREWQRALRCLAGGLAELAADWDRPGRGACAMAGGGAADVRRRRAARHARGRAEDDGGVRAVRPDDDRRRGRPGRVDEDPVRRRRASSRSVHAGRNVPFGIREHAMGAIVNGAAAHGGIVKPYGSTFLMFSDYMRGSVRLSALMGLPVVWVWTHDSVGLGEDGPTHQPIEHYASLRVIPQLWVIRPGDANETVAGVARRARARGRPRGAAALAPGHRRCSTARELARRASSSEAATCCGIPPRRRARPS